MKCELRYLQISMSAWKGVTEGIMCMNVFLFNIDLQISRIMYCFDEWESVGRVYLTNGAHAKHP